MGDQLNQLATKMKELREAKTGISGPKPLLGGSGSSASSGPKPLLGGSGSSASSGPKPPEVKPHSPMPGPNDPWPQPFWTGGMRRILKWTDPTTGFPIEFQSMLVEPSKWVQSSKNANGGNDASAAAA